MNEERRGFYINSFSSTVSNNRMNEFKLAYNNILIFQYTKYHDMMSRVY